jgi:hypothetical protein
MPAPFTETHPATPEPMPAASPAPSPPRVSRRDKRQREQDETNRRSGRLAAGRRDTEEPLPAVPPTAGAMATVAPSTSPKPSYTTILRPARRHREARDQDQSTADPARRRLIVLGVVIAMAAAAVGGVLAAGGGAGKPTPPPGPTPAQQRAAEQKAQQAAASQQSRVAASKQQAIVQDGNAQLVTVVKQLAPRRSRDVTRFANANGPTAQIATAKRVQTDYLKAAAQASAFTGQTPLAAPLTKALRTAASGYGSMASAARAQNDARFLKARQATTKAEKELSKQVATL